MDVTKEIQTFCDNVQNIRKKYFLSKKSMAMLIGIRKKDLLLIESGHLPDTVTVETLLRLHAVFDEPVDAFLSEVP